MAPGERRGTVHRMDPEWGLWQAVELRRSQYRCYSRQRDGMKTSLNIESPFFKVQD